MPTLQFKDQSIVDIDLSSSKEHIIITVENREQQEEKIRIQVDIDEANMLIEIFKGYVSQIKGA